MKTKEELNAIKEEIEALNRKLAELTDEELEQITGGKGGASGPDPTIKYVNGCGTFCTNLDCNWSDDSTSYTARTGSNRCPVCGSKVLELICGSTSTCCSNPDCDYCTGTMQAKEYCPQCGREMVYIISL